MHILNVSILSFIQTEYNINLYITYDSNSALPPNSRKPVNKQTKFRWPQIIYEASFKTDFLTEELYSWILVVGIELIAYRPRKELFFWAFLQTLRPISFLKEYTFLTKDILINIVFPLGTRAFHDNVFVNDNELVIILCYYLFLPIWDGYISEGQTSEQKESVSSESPGLALL